MDFYTVCPLCGRKLFTADTGSSVGIFCPRCNSELRITVADEKNIHIEILVNNYKPKKSKI